MKHRDAVAHVAHRHRQVDRGVDDFGGAASPRGQDEVVVPEPDPGRRVLRPGRQSRGRVAARSDSSATRAARFAERTDANAAVASTKVPPAVASEEIVTQSATCTGYVAAAGTALIPNVAPYAVHVG